MPETRQIMIVNDRPERALQMRMQLRDEGFGVELAGDGRQALRQLEGGARCEALVVGLALPGAEPLEFCRQVRLRHRYTPLILTVGQGGELPRVLALQVGADDCMNAEGSMQELVARIKALLRLVDGLARDAGSANNCTTVEGLVIDPLQRVAELDGQRLELTHREFDLLHFLVRHPGTVFSRLELLTQVWGYRHGGIEHTVHTHVNRLRAKIEADPKRPQRIITAWGRGYKFVGRPD
jgi:DNA-binding response OmpR family regulator